MARRICQRNVTLSQNDDGIAFRSDNNKRLASPVNLAHESSR
jgi:hypothetical protein